MSLELNKVYNMDCMEGMKQIPDKSVELVLTDIPYGEVNRKSNGLRNLDKQDADVFTIDLEELIKTMANKTNGSIYVFCGTKQSSDIIKILESEGFSTRIMCWQKTNPSPMNGDNIWLSGIELCVYGKRKGATFNEHCKTGVLRYPCGRNKIHPTQKPLEMFEYLLEVSTNEGDTVLDPFMGSATTAVAAINKRRNFIGFELNKEYFDANQERIKLAKIESNSLF